MFFCVWEINFLIIKFTHFVPLLTSAYHNYQNSNKVKNRIPTHLYNFIYMPVIITSQFLYNRNFFMALKIFLGVMCLMR